MRYARRHECAMARSSHSGSSSLGLTPEEAKPLSPGLVVPSVVGSANDAIQEPSTKHGNHNPNLTPSKDGLRPGNSNINKPGPAQDEKVSAALVGASPNLPERPMAKSKPITTSLSEGQATDGTSIERGNSVQDARKAYGPTKPTNDTTDTTEKASMPMAEEEIAKAKLPPCSPVPDVSRLPMAHEHHEEAETSSVLRTKHSAKRTAEQAAERDDDALSAHSAASQQEVDLAAARAKAKRAVRHSPSLWTKE